MKNTRAIFTKRMSLCIAAAVAALFVFATAYAKDNKDMHVPIANIAAWDDDAKEAMFEENPEALAEALNAIEPSN